MTLSNDALTTVWSNDHRHKLLIAYIKGGEVTLDIDYENLKIVTNGKRMQVEAGGVYRNSTRGVCGAMSGDPMTELIAPGDCYMSNPAHFGAMWAMTKEAQCEASVKELNRQAKAAPCSKNIKPNIVITKPQPPNSLGPVKITLDRPKDLRASKLRCRVHHSTQYEIEDGKICITVEPLPACSDDCVRGVGYVLEVN